MWGNKKAEPDSPPAAVPAPSKAPETNSTKPISASVEDNVMSTDAVRPMATTPAGATARLGASLHIKGEISGNEDLHVDGSVEGKRTPAVFSLAPGTYHVKVSRSGAFIEFDVQVRDGEFINKRVDF